MRLHSHQAAPAVSCAPETVPALRCPWKLLRSVQAAPCLLLGAAWAHACPRLEKHRPGGWLAHPGPCLRLLVQLLGRCRVPSGCSVSGHSASGGPTPPPSRKLEALRLVVTRWFSCPVSSCSSESELYIQAPPGCVPTQAPSPRHSESRPQPTRCSPLQSLLPASEPGASHKSRERTHALPLEFTNPGWCSVRMSDARASPTRPQGALLATQHPPAALQLVPGPCTQAALLP